ncbi:hypothetical protein CIP107539_00512 [Corynebacterium diphtheriae]|uniref:DUF4229 domain-containing protein n=2 Tax=Corynebacterium diphtheriae TaxID=1717 RepID=A0A811G1F0_CORDP|nr:hypothetical protein CIP107524_00373 [Corynebacterium diphtheriae]CAB0539210.1 hypothetical protein CIP107521_00524 [Corynebacterium diphtheriae]CAB0586374.1 hypothetical protein CIP107558_00354 [Corynebacterium diphtheriae]CAB0586441.1 hypothetical protein CIP107547_00518 [Corynebacterium diphtheriae]CAB0586878.1 hypothetical protein CIP107539_00512 [Corynebacterium diphtheriae]
MSRPMVSFSGRVLWVDDIKKPVIDPTVKSEARKAVVVYGLARFILFVVLTAVIQLMAVAIQAPVPLLISATLALIVAMPLSVFLFKGVRVRATQAVALWSEQRKAEKDWVKRELSNR